MVWVADLEPLAHGRVLPVGWLTRGRDYTRGSASAKFIKALSGLLVDPWHPRPTLAPSFHRCDFCRFSGGPRFTSVAGRPLEIGRRVLFVPSGRRVFMAPTMIVHYVDAHEYAPPRDFVKAVLACPPMKSRDYLRAVEPFKLLVSRIE